MSQVFPNPRHGPHPAKAQAPEPGAALELNFSAPTLERASYDLLPEKRIALGPVHSGIDLARGVIFPSYRRSDGTPLGSEIKLPACKTAHGASLTVAKLISGSLCHNLTIELPVDKDGLPVQRTASLYFPSQAVKDQVAELLAWTTSARAGTLAVGEKRSFDSLQLCDHVGQPLALNLFNVLESSAERWRDLFKFGQKPKSFNFECEALGDGGVKIEIAAEVNGRGGIVTKRTTYFLSEDRLLTSGEFKALQEIYSELPPGITREYFKDFRDQQFLAWLWRKYLEPGGTSHQSATELGLVNREGLEALFTWANGLQGQDENQFIFVSKLSLEMMKYLGALGKPHLDEMRHVGQRILLEQTTLEKGEFTSHNLLHGMPCANSLNPSVRLSPLLTCTAANLHHEAWMKARKWIQSLGLPELKQPDRKEHQPYDISHISSFWIRDCGNCYATCFMLGTFGEERYGSLHASAADQPMKLLDFTEESMAKALLAPKSASV